jgi:hypothetical protein
VDRHANRRRVDVRIGVQRADEARCARHPIDRVEGIGRSVRAEEYEARSDCRSVKRCRFRRTRRTDARVVAADDRKQKAQSRDGASCSHRGTLLSYLS